MQINGGVIVDIKSYLLYYIEKGLNTDELRKCNSQEFKYIGGYGEGSFLMTDTLYVTGQTINLTSPVTKTLYVTEVIDTLTPDYSGKHITIVKTAESKFRYTHVRVLRNFNVINRRTQIANTALLVAPDDDTALTVKQVIEEIVGATIHWSAPSIFPYDAFIMGMNALDAIDYLCSIYGLVWTADSDGTIYVWALTDPSSTDLSNIVDIRNQTINPPISAFNVIYPILDCCQQYPKSYENQVSYSATEGRKLSIYVPLYPAIYTSTGSLQNGSDLTFVSSSLFTIFQALNQVEGNYLAREFYLPINFLTQPQYFSILYADYGAGPRTILSAREYPYHQIPPAAVLDRQARNWVGYLYQSYKGPVAGFVVVPAFGIDGLIPNSNQYVVNLYKWDYGAAAAAVRVEWDCVNYRWIPLQQEYVCPPTTSVATPDPPPDIPPYPPISYE